MSIILGNSVWIREMEPGKEYAQSALGATIRFTVKRVWNEGDRWFFETTKGSTHMQTDVLEHYSDSYYEVLEVYYEP